MNIIARDAYDFEAITVSTTAVGLTASKETPTTPNTIRPQIILLQATDQPLRFRIDSGTPTAAAGMRLGAGESIYIYGNTNIVDLLMIREGGTDSVAQVTYFR